jgi:uroporphyrinogen decarboxylase
MNELSHRERVLMAFRHEQPDRPPMDMMGNASMLLDGTYLRLRDHLGLPAIPPVRSNSTANYYDERILEILDIDFRRVFLPRNPASQRTTFEDGSYLDEFNVRNIHNGIYINAVEHPLQHASSLREIEEFSWPEPAALFTTQGLAEIAQRMYAYTDYAIVARNPITSGFLDRSCLLMGMAEFMMCMSIQPQVAHRLIDHLMEIYKGIYNLFLEAVGPYVQMVEYGDDLGGQNSSLISPQMFREFIFPAEKALFSHIKEKAPQAAIFHHSDGSIFKLIPGLIEAGVGVLNPVQTSTKGMEGRLLKDTFGKQLTFHGAIEKMERPLDELVAEAKEKLNIFAPGGGYVFASCNHMIDVPPENILAMFETAGGYKTPSIH